MAAERDLKRSEHQLRIRGLIEDAHQPIDSLEKGDLLEERIELAYKLDDLLWEMFPERARRKNTLMYSVCASVIFLQDRVAQIKDRLFRH